MTVKELRDILQNPEGGFEDDYIVRILINNVEEDLFFNSLILKKP